MNVNNVNLFFLIFTVLWCSLEVTSLDYIKHFILKKNVLQEMRGNLCLPGKQDKERFVEHATSIIAMLHYFYHN